MGVSGPGNCGCWVDSSSFFACYWYLCLAFLLVFCALFIARTICLEWREPKGLPVIPQFSDEDSKDDEEEEVDEDEIDVYDEEYYDTDEDSKYGSVTSDADVDIEINSARSRALYKVQSGAFEPISAGDQSHDEQSKRVRNVGLQTGEGPNAASRTDISRVGEVRRRTGALEDEGRSIGVSTFSPTSLEKYRKSGIEEECVVLVDEYDTESMGSTYESDSVELDDTKDEEEKKGGIDEEKKTDEQLGDEEEHKEQEEEKDEPSTVQGSEIEKEAEEKSVEEEVQENPQNVDSSVEQEQKSPQHEQDKVDGTDTESKGKGEVEDVGTKDMEGKDVENEERESIRDEIPDKGKEKVDEIEKDANEEEKTEEQEVSGDKTKEQEVDKTKQQEVSGDKTKKQEVSGDKTKQQEVSGDKTKKQEVSGDKTKQQEVSGDKTKKQEVSGDKTKTQEVSGDKTKKQEVSGDKTKQQEVSGDKTKKQEVSGDKTRKQELSGDKTKKQEVSGDKTRKQEMSGDKTKGVSEVEGKSVGDKEARNKILESSVLAALGGATVVGAKVSKEGGKKKDPSDGTAKDKQFSHVRKESTVPPLDLDGARAQKTTHVLSSLMIEDTSDSLRTPQLEIKTPADLTHPSLMLPSFEDYEIMTPKFTKLTADAYVDMKMSLSPSLGVHPYEFDDEKLDLNLKGLFASKLREKGVAASSKVLVSSLEKIRQRQHDFERVPSLQTFWSSRMQKLANAARLRVAGRRRCSVINRRRVGTISSTTLTAGSGNVVSLGGRSIIRRPQVSQTTTAQSPQVRRRAATVARTRAPVAAAVKMEEKPQVAPTVTRPRARSRAFGRGPAATATFNTSGGGGSVIPMGGRAVGRRTTLNKR